MKRRDALKNTAFFVGGTAAFSTIGLTTGCTSAPQVDWTSMTDPFVRGLLEEIAETIIPVTDTPGAKDLKLVDHVSIMLADCHEPEEQQDFLAGLKLAEENCAKVNGKGFMECTSEVRKEYLISVKDLSDDNAELAPAKSFFSRMKRLTLQGYMKSEYVNTNITKYKLVPGPYIACTDA